jgi:3-hydroxy-3-methylglutaryl CoA synthase
MIGITSYGAYIPRLRLNRSAIYQSMGWFAPAIVMVAQGTRSMCNWDEDAITMSVEASRSCLEGMDKNISTPCFWPPPPCPLPTGRTPASWPQRST